MKVLEDVISSITVDAPVTDVTRGIFDHGIDIISGSIVTDPDTALFHIRQGAHFRQLKRTGSIQLVTLIKDQGGHRSR